MRVLDNIYKKVQIVNYILICEYQYSPTRKCNLNAKTCLLLYHCLTSTFNPAPLDELTPHILRYCKVRLNDKEIARALHFDTDRYGIGCALEMFISWCLIATIGQT